MFLHCKYTHFCGVGSARYTLHRAFILCHIWQISPKRILWSTCSNTFSGDCKKTQVSAAFLLLLLLTPLKAEEQWFYTELLPGGDWAPHPVPNGTVKKNPNFSRLYSRFVSSVGHLPKLVMIGKGRNKGWSCVTCLSTFFSSHEYN